MMACFDSPCQPIVLTHNDQNQPVAAVDSQLQIRRPTATRLHFIVSCFVLRFGFRF